MGAGTDPTSYGASTWLGLPCSFRGPGISAPDPWERGAQCACCRVQHASGPICDRACLAERPASEQFDAMTARHHRCNFGNGHVLIAQFL